MRFARRVLCATAIALVVWSITAAIFSEVSLRPRRRFAPVPPAIEAAVRRDARTWDSVTTAAADGAVLKAWFLSPRAGDRGCVLLLHGVATSRASGLGLADMLLDAGYSVLLPDSRGHGESGGSMVTYGLLERTDVLGWAAWSHAHGCSRLFGLGVSMGGAELIMSAAQEPVFQAIVAECPYSDLRTTGEARIVQKLPVPNVVSRAVAVTLVPIGIVYVRLVHGLDLDTVSPVKSAAALKTPLLLIHGLDDVKIAPANSIAIAAAARNATLWLVPHAGHIAASMVAPAEFRARVLGWFQAHAAP